MNIRFITVDSVVAKSRSTARRESSLVSSKTFCLSGSSNEAPLDTGTPELYIGPVGSTNDDNPTALRLSEMIEANKTKRSKCQFSISNRCF